MDPNEQPDGTPDRTITIRLTRDTLILLAALVFLAVAILLAVIFPATTPGDVTDADAIQTAAVVAAAPTAPLPTEPTQPPTDPYPEPTDSTDALPNDDDAPLNDAPLPTFAPVRPTPDADDEDFNFDDPYPVPNADDDPLPTPDDDVIFEPDDTFDPDEDDVFQPEDTPAPIQRPAPTQRPAPADPVEPVATAPPVAPAPTIPPAPPAPPAPTPLLIDQITGNVRWSRNQNPVIIPRDLQITAGSSLVIEPGVEVRLGPGVTMFVDGSITAVGEPGQPVQFVSLTGQRWDGIYGRSGSNITLDQTEIRGGGNGGTVLTSENGTLTLRGVLVTDNGGHIRVNSSRLEVRDSEISGNDMPFGAAVDASYAAGGFVTLVNNRIGGNRMAFGSPPVQIINQSGIDTVILEARSNLLVGQDGPNLVLIASGPFQGDITCNTMINGLNGLSVRSQTLQLPAFPLNVRDNAIEDHTPPIIPEYLRFGIGRGATSEVALDMRNNWWNSPLGPYHPELHADGRGDAVGVNIEFMPWLTQRPACAPQP